MRNITIKDKKTVLKSSLIYTKKTRKLAKKQHLISFLWINNTTREHYDRKKCQKVSYLTHLHHTDDRGKQIFSTFLIKKSSP